MGVSLRVAIVLVLKMAMNPEHNWMTVILQIDRKIITNNVLYI